MNIAYFSPLPPDRSGIAAYSAMLLPHLTDHASLTLFTDHPEATDSALAAQFPIRQTASFAGPLAEGVDLCLYQMGSNILYHRETYHVLRRHPGVVVLHDPNLHSLYGELYVRPGQWADYEREMAFSHGKAGVAHARQARRGECAHDIHRFPLNGRLLRGSLGVIALNEFSAAQLRSASPQARLQAIPLLQAPLTAGQPIAAKTDLGYNPETVLLASFGYVADFKRVDVALRAFAALHGRFPHLRYALVGQVIEGYNLDALLAELNLNNELVRLVGYADEATFASYLAATDIGINLRYPTGGESSATLLQLLACGKPTLVTRADAFVEVPATAVIHIPIGPEEQAAVETAVAGLIENEARRREMGAAAAQLVAERHAPAAVARQYADFLRQVLQRG